VATSGFVVVLLELMLTSFICEIFRQRAGPLEMDATIKRVASGPLHRGPSSNNVWNPSGFDHENDEGSSRDIKSCDGTRG
jgi:hypothetical protein